MSELDKGSQNIGSDVESKEGERGPLSSSKANVRSPSLNYEYVQADGLEKAFDVLFKETIKSDPSSQWK